jgi:hypothetical protein
MIPGHCPSLQQRNSLPLDRLYDWLVDHNQQQHGKLTVESALCLMDDPVTTSSNWLNVLLEPKSTHLWIANAGSSGEPAATQN